MLVNLTYGKTMPGCGAVSVHDRMIDGPTGKGLSDLRNALEAAKDAAETKEDEAEAASAEDKSE